MSRPFDAVLIVSFGGPQGPADVRPFLERVLRGRPVPAGRIEEVARHYELFGGVSPVADLTRRMAGGLADRLRRDGPALPVFVGMRNWRPWLADTMADMAGAGVRRAIGLATAPHRSYSSCLQYRENVRDARRELARRGLPDVQVTWVHDWHVHPGFIEANARHVGAAAEWLPASSRAAARLLFTAHSIPAAMAEAYPYCQQLRESALATAERTAMPDWALVYQSRSGRAGEPWLEPDICDYLRVERARGLEAAVVCPIGFVSDHIEVLYDLDHQMMQVAREVGILVARAETAGSSPLFLDAVADVVRKTYRRYELGVPLPIAHPDAS